MSATDTPIGVDLGHSYCCFGLYRQGEVSVIANEQGERSTPCVLAFTDKEQLLGDAAQTQSAVNLANTVHHIKKILGLPYEHPLVSELQARVHYALIRDATNGMPRVRVTLQGSERTYTPVALVAALLHKMRNVAERNCGHSCEQCVLAAPSFYTQAQRDALVEAGKEAGFTVLCVLSEAVAACMAFGLDLPEAGAKKAQQILVLDVGGATSCATVLSVEAGKFVARHALADVHLGGDDLDDKMVQHFAAEFKKRTGHDITQSHRAMSRLSLACERAKRVLSSSTQAAIECDSLFEGEDLFATITRAKFESLCMPTLRKMAALASRCIAESGLTAAQIDHVLVAGGSVRIPRLMQLIKAAVPSREPQRLNNPEEAVAQGCALQAALLAHRSNEWKQALQPTDSATKPPKRGLRMSIGIEGEDGIMQRILFRKQPIPAIATFQLTLPVSSEPLVLRLVEGDHAIASQNHLLGVMQLLNQTQSESTVKAVIMVAADRTVTMTAQGSKLIIPPTLSSATSQQLESLEKPDENEMAYRSLSESRAGLRQLVEESVASLSKHEKGRHLLADTRKWLLEHSVANSSLQEDEFAEKRAVFEQQMEQISKDGSSSSSTDLDDYLADVHLNGNGTAEHELSELD